MRKVILLRYEIEVRGNVSVMYFIIAHTRYLYYKTLPRQVPIAIKYALNP